jgi:hypothetical protein
LSSLRDIAESDLCASAPEDAPKEPKPPRAGCGVSRLSDVFAAERLLKEPKPPEDGFDALDEEDEEDDEDDERCDENPLLKDDELDGLASAGAAASGRIRASANATCANFGMVFNMVRRAGES